MQSEGDKVKKKAEEIVEKSKKRFRIDGTKINNLNDITNLIDVLRVQLPGDLKDIERIQHILTEVDTNETNDWTIRTRNTHSGDSNEFLVEWKREAEKVSAGSLHDVWEFRN